MAHRAGDDVALATALSAAQFTTWRPGMVETRLPLADELLHVVEWLGNLERVAEALMWRAGALLTLCRLDEADADLARIAELAERLDQPELIMHCASLRSMRALLEGHWDEGERAADEVLRVGERALSLLALQEYGVAMLVLRSEQLRLGEEVERFEEVARSVEHMPAWRAPLAWAYAQSGRLGPARDLIAELRRDGFAVLPRDVNFHAGLTMLAHAADELGDAELAGEIEPLLRPLAAYWVVLGVGSATLGPVAYSLGVCNLLAGRPDAAVADFELAIAKCRLMRARPYEAHASLRLARALTLRDGPGDAERAVALERDAVAIAHELGLPRLLRDARKVAARSPQRPPGSF